MTARAALLLAFVLVACSSPDLPASNQRLDPVAFFTGVTSGSGTLDPIVGRSSAIRVESRGSRTDAGGLTLIQRISEGTKPPRIRSWIMQPVSPGRYTGTLTDAEGPVEITVVGSLATVRYRTPSGLRIQQQLALQPDGQTILNRLEAFKFGVRVAVLNETIRK